jgi:hypothetical protein
MNQHFRGRARETGPDPCTRNDPNIAQGVQISLSASEDRNLEGKNGSVSIMERTTNPDLTHCPDPAVSACARLVEWAFETAPNETATLVSTGDERIALRPAEVVCLIVGHVWGLKNEPFGYAEVIDFSFRFMPKPLAEGTVHKCFQGLLEYDLVSPFRIKRPTRAGRPREMYVMTPAGKIAFALAIATAKHLAESRSLRAA